MTELNAAVTYIQKVCRTSAASIDWDKFRGLFAKGILKYSILTAAKKLEQTGHQEKSMLIKMNEQKRKELMHDLETKRKSYKTKWLKNVEICDWSLHAIILE